MDHLTLVRVHESGRDLVVRAQDGTEYLVALDEALKRAVRVPVPVPRQEPLTPAAPGPLSPREIQARIRAGESAAQIAEDTGTQLEHILRYEGPVLAEREYVSQQARGTEVSPPLGHEGYRAAFGDEAATLGEMVRIRLRAFGVDPATLTWDAWKLQTGTWRIVARFEVPEDSAAIGEEPPAEWTFHPARRHLENANRWGQVLSEWEPWEVLPTQRRLVAVGDRPFDVEAGGELSEPTPEPEEVKEDDLLDVLSRRRGTRVGEDVEGDDALAHLLARSHIEREAAEAERADQAHRPEPAQRTEGPAEPAPGSEPRPWVPAGSDAPAVPGRPGRTDGRVEPEHPDRAWPPLRRVPDPVPASRLTEDEDEADDAPRPHRKRRSQVPSWDEIVFGRSAKGEDDEE